MNIFNTHLPQTTGAEGTGAGSVLDNLGNQLVLDPKSLELLKQKSIEEGVNFGDLLQMAKDGKDPEALLELMKAEKDNHNPELAKEIGQQLGSETKNQQTTPVNSEMLNNITGDESKVVKQNESTELKNILNLNQSKTAQGPELTQETTKQVLNNKQAILPQAKVNKAEVIMPAENGKVLEIGKLNQNQQAKLVNSTVSPVTNKTTAVETANAEKVLAKNNGLVNLNQFVNNQSPTLQKRAAQSAYKPISTSMFDKKVEASLPGVIKKAETPNLGKTTTINDLILNPDMASGDEINITASAVKPAAASLALVGGAKQTFDMAQINSSDSSLEIINKVQDYIIQSKASNEQKVEMSFQHKDLGKVDLMVQKGLGDQLNIAINSHTLDGAKFFTKHQGDLMHVLSQSGIQVGEFKLDSSQNSQTGSQNESSHRQQFAQNNNKEQFGSEAGQRDHDSRKRQELWDQFYQKEVA